MPIAPAPQRTPLVISAGTLVAGPVNASFREGDPASLLHSYLVLIRQLRGQQREPTITLRSADISALAGHLGSSEERVLDDLLARMGATRAQRRALAALFAVGALTIVATGSIALDLSSGGVFARDTDGVVREVVQQSPVVTTVDQVAPVRTEAIVAAPSATPSIIAAPAALPAPGLAIAGQGADWQLAVATQMLTEALAAQSTDQAVSAPTQGEGVADDGSIVAVGRAPVPPVAVPPVEGQGVADDGSIVAVGTPPLPPPSIP